ncbi:MAG: PA2778 family cysteine peptidase [Ectothiorhodospiraceae bacterium]|nr:PA2778 family cysteine peptidase [Ectothiorhodospiraceae bacterium]
MSRPHTQPTCTITTPDRQWLSLILCLLLVGLLTGCAGLGRLDPQDAFSTPPEAVELTGVPWHPQEALQCGPAALAEVLGWTGVDITPEALEPRLFIPAREGTLQTELVAQARQHDRAVHILDRSFDAILQELHHGHPVLVFQNLGLGWAPVWHFAVVVGYDPETARFILRSGPHEREKLGLDTFRRTWERTDRWAMVVTRPDTLPATATPTRWLRSASDLEETGRLEAARTAYATGRERWPDQAGFHLALVNLDMAAGDLEAAEHAARRGLDQANGGHGVLYNNLAQVLAQQQRWDEAEQAAMAAVAEGGRFAESFARTLEQVRCRGQADCPAP